MTTKPQKCPCCSGRSFQQCCAPLLDGSDPARSAEALMRSRFTAYTFKEISYLLASWHPTTRPQSIAPDTIPRWLKLEIIRTSKGQPQNNTGIVEFKASYLADHAISWLHEASRFSKEDGRWYYIDGDILPLIAPAKTGRNSPCPCGSGKKFKRCCGP